MFYVVETATSTVCAEYPSPIEAGAAARQDPRRWHVVDSRGVRVGA